MDSSTLPAPSLQWLELANPTYGIKISRGNILWLKSKSACCVQASFAYLDMEDGCFDHPALILHSDPQQATATILLVSKASKSLQIHSSFLAPPPLITTNYCTHICATFLSSPTNIPFLPFLPCSSSHP